MRPQPGGRHAAMGTHNALVALGSRIYLELIAIDPAAPAPLRPRWFDLDSPRMRAQLAEQPTLIHWVVRTDDIEGDAARSTMDPGTILKMRRGVHEWRISVPDDGHLPGRGLVPTLIEWTAGPHPTDALIDDGAQLVALAGEHPEPAPVRAALAAMGLSESLKVTYGRTPRLAAMIRTRRGIVTL